MNRGLGAGLVLSVLAHGGAVAVIAALGAAWRLGPSPAPSPPALYVDLVHPVVATSDRHETAEGATSRPLPGPSRGGEVAAARTSRGPAPLREKAASPPPSAIPQVSPAAEGQGPAKVELEVVPPPPAPTAPRTPDARAESAAAPTPTSERPVPSPRIVPTPLPLPATPPPVDAGPRTPAVDAGRTASRPLASASPVPVAPSNDLVAGRHAPSGSSATSLRESSSPGVGASVDAGTRGMPEGSGGFAPARGNQPAPGDGTGLARLSPGDGESGSAATGAIPPEYESYVRALRQRIQDRLVYPWMAVRRGQQGVVELEVRLGADGRLVGVEVVAGVSADALREAAVSAVRGSAPFPFPSGLAPRPLVVRLPVEFRLR